MGLAWSTNDVQPLGFCQLNMGGGGGGGGGGGVGGNIVDTIDSMSTWLVDYVHTTDSLAGLETSTQLCLNAGPTPQTRGQHLAIARPTTRLSGTDPWECTLFFPTSN